MNKQDRINKLIKHCKELSSLNDLSKEKTEGLKKLALLAREGKKETEEFKYLYIKYMDNTVIDYGDVVRDIVNTVKYL